MSRFDQWIERRNTDSLKWSCAQNELPMWVADMDFEAAPCIRQAILRRAERGVFGYSVIPDSWAKAYSDWWQARHNLQIERDELIFCTGVIPAISCLVKRLTNCGDKVICQTPVYDIFFHSIENAGRTVLESPLAYRDGKYAVDWEDLEEKLAHPLATLMILCNPHNPVGKIWSKAELARLGDLCAKYGVTVISDEIHCDLTDIGAEYTPFAAASEVCAQNSVTCIAASKAFNMAGLQSAAVFTKNKRLWNIAYRGLNSDEIAEPNSFAVDATVAAFTQGGEWLDELRAYLLQNKRYVADYLRENLPCLHLVEQNATYLLWVDCSAVTDDAEQLCIQIRQKTGLWITAGGQYRGNGKQFVRINVACPLERVKDGMNRLKCGISD